MPELSQGGRTVLWLFLIAGVFIVSLWVIRLAQSRRALFRQKAVVVATICVGAPIVLALFAGVLASLGQFLVAAFDYSGEESHAAIRNIGLVLAAVFGAPFVAWRSYVAHKQTAISEQSHITDQINKAVEGLGAEKTVKSGGDELTRPNIEVRIGAIYALERIAQDSDRDHIKIMEIICAYIRSNFPTGDLASTTPPFQKKTPRIDLQSAIRTLGRRSKDKKEIEAKLKFRLDLRGCDLSFVDFEEGDFSAAMFHECKIECGNFRECHLRGTEFVGSTLNHCNFFEALLHGTNLDHVKIEFPQIGSGAMSDSITLAKKYGVTMVGATMPAINYLGEPGEVKNIFGLSDTLLHSQIAFQPELLREQRRLLRQANNRNDNAGLAKATKNLVDNPYEHWSWCDQRDGMTNHLRKKFQEKLGLLKWPYR